MDIPWQQRASGDSGQVQVVEQLRRAIRTNHLSGRERSHDARAIKPALQASSGHGYDDASPLRHRLSPSAVGERGATGQLLVDDLPCTGGGPSTSVYAAQLAPWG